MPDAIASQHGLDRDLVIELVPGQDLDAELAAWASRPEVEWAEPDGIVRIQTVPSDPQFSQQWALRNTGQAPAYGSPDCDIDADEAWSLFTGSTAVKIAILDTGVDLDHPDLASKIVAGYDFVNNDAVADDDNGHGTACASIAAGVANNSIGLAGVDWQARIMPIKVLSAGGGGTVSAVAAGTNWARQNGANVISMSLGGALPSSTLEAAINAAVAAGVVVVAAAGNDDTNSVAYPAAYPNCIAVGALSPCNRRKTPSTCDGEWWWGSNYGAALDIMAPGVLLRSAWVGGGYIGSMNGTSGATPHVAGVAALVKGRNPSLLASQIRSIICTSADDIGAAGWDEETGWGRLNARSAIEAATVVGRSITAYATHCYRDGSDWNNVAGALGAPRSTDNQDITAFAYNDVMSSSQKLYADAFGLDALVPGERIIGVYVNASARYDMGTSSNRLRMLARYVNDLGQSVETISDSPPWSQSSSDDVFRWRMSGLGWDITGLRSSWTPNDVRALRLGVRRLANVDPVAPSRCRVTAIRIVVVTTFDAVPAMVAAQLDDGARPAPEAQSAADAKPALILSASPNPFNPATTLSFEVPHSGRVELRLFDVRGHLVKDLANGPMAAGRHVIPLDGTGLASGIYLVSAQVDGVRETLRIILLK